MTLSELSYSLRRLLPVVFLGIAAFIAFFLVLRLFFLSRKAPQKVAVYNTLFGKLPKIQPSHTVTPPEGISFELDNIEGRPIIATDSAQVFFLPEKKTRFGYLQKSYLMAKTVGFDTQLVPHQTGDETTISFTDNEKKLTIDIASFNFEYKVNYENTPLLFEIATPTEEAVAKEKAREFLRSLDNYPEEMAQGTENVIYMNYDPVSQAFTVVDDVRQANVVEVDYFRSDIDTYPVVSPKYFNSSNFVVMVFKDQEHKVIKAQMKFFERDKENIGVYPLTSGDQAWSELNTNKGFVVSPGGRSYPIKIQKMFLGYYEPDSYQRYLQPVFVFLGENNFAAYVPAIGDNYIEQ